MKRQDYHIYLDEQEYSQVIQSLITLKNNLIAQGRYTDAVDDVLIEYSAQVEHPDRFELNSLTAKTEQSSRRD